MDRTSDHDDLLLPAGTRLVHIGPPKTATSYVQAAFHAARAATEAQGVHYAGRHRHSAVAVQAVAGRPGFFTEGRPAPMRHWDRLVGDVRGSHAARVVISSEFFADAPTEAIPRILDDLDRSRIHIVVTLRPLARIIPSQWQQYVQSGAMSSYDTFLDRMFNTPGTSSPTFWRRHRHDELVARWADAVGADRVTVVVLDERDPDLVLRVFERMTGLHEGTLVAQPDLTNRSMTLPEIEAVRALNRALKAEGMGRAAQSRIVHFGAATYMRRRTPDTDEPRVETPEWVLDRVRVIAREAVDAIGASGVRIVGDLERLAAVPTSGRGDDPPPPVVVPPAVAASMAMGVLFASGLAPEPRPDAPKGWDGRSTTRSLAVRAEPVELLRVPTRDLVGILARRGARRLTSRIGTVGRRNGSAAGH